MVVGWYHSHPGFGCWLSSVDVNTQQVSHPFCNRESRNTFISFGTVHTSFLSVKTHSCLVFSRPTSTRGFGLRTCDRDILMICQSFEQLHPRAVAVVIDPIQSVRGKVVIDAFRSINPHSLIAGQESRQTTSNIGHLNKPSIQALIHGLNRHYYSQFPVPPSWFSSSLQRREILLTRSRSGDRV